MSCFDQDPNEQANISGSDFAQMCDEIKSLKSETCILKQALRFYASQANWERDFGDSPVCVRDFGDTARKTLEEFK